MRKRSRKLLNVKLKNWSKDNILEIGDIIEISSKINWTPASTWNTYLCLERLSEDKYEVSIRGYEYLCEVDDIQEELNLIEDENFDMYEHLPYTDKGKKVMELVEMNLVMGGDLEKCYDPDGVVCVFSKDNPESIKDYLLENDWPLENYLSITGMYED